MMEVTRGELDRMTGGAVHQGLAARLPSYEYAHPDDLLRRAQVAVGLAGMSPENLPLRPWGEDELMVPAVGADALARWCDCAWRPCRWCDAGGAAQGPCPACGDRGTAA